jgi:hypothetical protein
VTPCDEAEARRCLREVLKCRKSFPYFCDTFCRILHDGGRGGEWAPFRLWPGRRRVARLLQENRLVVALKARQLGLTWLTLAFALWLLLFHPIATVLLFSRRDDEARDLLAVRLRGMYDRLPPWLKTATFAADNDREWRLGNDSRALALPTTAGDGYTATLAVVDEADLCPDLDRLLRAVKPTIDGGGRLVLLSRSDKSRPHSPFKRIYAAARQGQTAWAPVFLPWWARPDRTRAWYDAQAADVLHRTGGLDDLHEQYPATDAEALAPRALDKRIAPQWLHRCYREQDPPAEPLPGAPSIPGLEVYAPPQAGRSYVIGADPVEGNPASEASALTVLDRESGEQAAALAARFEPAVFAAHIHALGRWYGGAGVLVERNNHGHAVLLWLADHTALRRLPGHDGKPGWLSNSKGKALLYDAAADAFREGRTVLHSFATFAQLASIEGGTLRAPQGEADDRADGYALACRAREVQPYAPYTGPLVYNSWAPWPPDEAPEPQAKGPLHALLDDLGIDCDGDWEAAGGAWR